MASASASLPATARSSLPRARPSAAAAAPSASRHVAASSRPPGPRTSGAVSRW
jgi:hypothetical protein